MRPCLTTAKRTTNRCRCPMRAGSATTRRLQMRPQVPPVIQSGILNDGKERFCPIRNTSQLVATADVDSRAQPGISQPVFMSVSALLQTTRGRYLLDGQNHCLADIPVSLTNADVHRSIRFTRNRAVQFRLQLLGPWRGDAQDHWRVVPI